MQKVLSIEIGIATIKVCEMDQNKKNPKIYRTFLFDTPDNTVEDGYIRDKDALSLLLSQKLKEAGCKTKNVIFSIASSKILSREVTIPLVKDSLIKVVVDAEANDYFPRDITDHIVTYTVLEKKTDEKKIQLITYAAPANLVKNYYSFAEMLGMNIIALDYAGNASYQWLKKKINTDTGFVLQINEENSIVTILQDGVLLLQRNINYGINYLAQSLLETDVYDSSDVAAAREVLFHQPLMSSKEQTAENQIELNQESISPEQMMRMLQVKESINEAMHLFISNLSRIIEYQTTRSNQQNKPIAIHEITIAGAGTQIQGIDTFIGNELGIPVHTNEKVTEIQTKKSVEVSPQQLEEFVTCFGAVIAPVRFVPKDYEQTKEKREFWKAYIGLGLGVAVACSLMVITSYSAYQSEKERQSKLIDWIDTLSYIEGVDQNYQSVKKEYFELKEADASTASCNEVFTALLSELEKKLPSGCVVHSLSSANNQLTMSMSASSKEIAATVLLQLKQLEYISEVSITGLTESKDEATGLTDVSFAVSCTFHQIE